MNKDKYLAQHTVDQISIGEMQPERDHQFDSYKCTVGERLNRKIRETEVNGWGFDAPEIMKSYEVLRKMTIEDKIDGLGSRLCRTKWQLLFLLSD
jgi:hypothetical protein